MRLQYIWVLLASMFASALASAGLQSGGPAAQAPTTGDSGLSIEVLDDAKPIELWYHRDRMNLSGTFALMFVNRGPKTTVTLAAYYRTNANKTGVARITPSSFILPPGETTPVTFSVAVIRTELPAAAF